VGNDATLDGGHHLSRVAPGRSGSAQSPATSAQEPSPVAALEDRPVADRAAGVCGPDVGGRAVGQPHREPAVVLGPPVGLRVQPYDVEGEGGHHVRVEARLPPRAHVRADDRDVLEAVEVIGEAAGGVGADEQAVVVEGASQGEYLRENGPHLRVLGRRAPLLPELLDPAVAAEAVPDVGVQGGVEHGGVAGLEGLEQAGPEAEELRLLRGLVDRVQRGGLGRGLRPYAERQERERQQGQEEGAHSGGRGFGWRTACQRRRRIRWVRWRALTGRASVYALEPICSAGLVATSGCVEHKRRRQRVAYRWVWWPPFRCERGGRAKGGRLSSGGHQPARSAFQIPQPDSPRPAASRIRCLRHVECPKSPHLPPNLHTCSMVATSLAAGTCQLYASTGSICSRAWASLFWAS
jgi:hypothetical protein